MNSTLRFFSLLSLILLHRPSLRIKSSSSSSLSFGFFANSSINSLKSFADKVRSAIQRTIFDCVDSAFPMDSHAFSYGSFIYTSSSFLANRPRTESFRFPSAVMQSALSIRSIERTGNAPDNRILLFQQGEGITYLCPRNQMRKANPILQKIFKCVDNLIPVHLRNTPISQTYLTAI